MRAQRGLSGVKLCLALVLLLQLAFWSASRQVIPKWGGVPPVPTQQGATMMTLGDPEFSFRFLAITLQSLGDGNGQSTPLKDYNYATLGQWFFLLNRLDAVSDHVPMIAAYYFGATRVPKDVAEVVKYLGQIGQDTRGEKWRWLAQAVYLARHRMDDLSLALDLAYKLAKLEADAPMPSWTKQMPAFILKEQGDTAAARQLMEEMLLSTQQAHPNEINFMSSYLVEQLGVDPKEVEAVMRMRAAPLQK
jgi:hypothetical protein